eukprot:GCRY01002406.1.p1 GENE.GCRY01002406.1~~GCRY01002406.1.p1  ORF type:complete len:404 (-),score=50.40 GCRY01002406.1:895-2106(-)
MSCNSFFSSVPVGPSDPILSLTTKFKKDQCEKKVNLGVGAYRDDNGKPVVLKCVKKAEEILLAEDVDHEYSGVLGEAVYRQKAQEVLFGADREVQKIATIQSISGTGALHLGARLLKDFHTNQKVYISKPSWGNHRAVFKHVGLEVDEYPFYDYNSPNGGVVFTELVKKLQSLETGAVVILHACAHNPTGVDLTQEQWQEIETIFREKELFPFFDVAYQGFATGDLDADAYAVRYFMKKGHTMLVAQSFAKNFGLYGERCGALHFISAEPAVCTAVSSQLALIARRVYSQPAIHGANIVRTVLSSPELTALWHSELNDMSDRIRSMRALLVEKLEALGAPKGKWSHIVSQIGMFCFTGLNKEQVERMLSKSIYMTNDGRISISGLNSRNIDYVAQCLYEVSQS